MPMLMLKITEPLSSFSVQVGWKRLAKYLLDAVCLLNLMCAFALQAQQSAPGSGKAANPAKPIFESTCGVCHGTDGRGGEHAPNIATKREMVSMSDTQLNRILHNGVLASGMPAFGYLGDEKITQLVGYLRELQGIAGAGEVHLSGDVAEGEKIFFAKGSCSGCHMAGGRGGFLGEDLSGYARGRSAEVIRAAILQPEDDPGDADHLAEIQTADGRFYRGLVRSRDNFSVVLQGEDGAFHSIARDRIHTMIFNSLPLMPQDYKIKLDERQLNNLISYLQKVSASASAASKSGEKAGNEE